MLLLAIHRIQAYKNFVLNVQILGLPARWGGRGQPVLLLEVRPPRTLEATRSSKELDSDQEEPSSELESTHTQILLLGPPEAVY